MGNHRRFLWREIRGNQRILIRKRAENGILLDGLYFDKNGSVVTANIMENDNSVDGNGAAGDNTPNPDANGTDGPSNCDANGPGDSSNSFGTVVVFNEDVISNLQLQVEEVDAEMAFDENGAQTYESPSFTSQKKRQ